MRICVVGAGAMGGLLGGRLALAGEEVAFVDVGRHLEAIQRDGLKLVTADGVEEVVRPARATSDAGEVGVQDLIVVAVKAHVTPHVAPTLRDMMAPHTIVLPVQNGIPWWYFQRHGGDLDGLRLKSVDPDGTVARSIEPERVIGCVAYPAAEVVAPGVVRQVEGRRFPLGELDGRRTARAEALAEALDRAGLKSFVIDDIRAEIWLKLWGNLALNYVCALTHTTLVDVCRFSPTRELAVRLMEEAQTVARRLGIKLRVSLEKRLAGAERVGRHRPSTLQDLEAGRRLEVDPMIGAVVEMGQLLGVPTPHMDSVYALTKLLDRTVQGERGAVRLEPLPARRAA